MGLNLRCSLLLASACVLLRIPATLAEIATNDSLRDALAQRDFPARVELTSADNAYLHGLARDTWSCMAELVDPTSGLPYDNSDRGEYTSVSNIGFYLTCVIAARDLGFITDADALRRLDQTLAAVEKLRTWRGFQQCWNSAKTLRPATHDPAISLLDTGNFVAGLITVSQASPRHHDRCEKLLTAMDWAWFYDPQKGLLRGGFNTERNQFAEGWYLSALATDAQLCQFIAIASGAAPAGMWDRLDRPTETRFGVTYMQPGWQGGGLFMQYISGLWLDESHTLMQRSAENFAYSQIRQAGNLESPVWGWSASAGPGGDYLGWGHLKEEVVTPHACVLAIDRFPSQVAQNLRALEKLGARPAGSKGFIDSVNWKTGQCAKTYLSLDQGMLLTSLTNHLKDNAIRKYFQAHPLVQRGHATIREFRQPMFRS